MGLPQDRLPDETLRAYAKRLMTSRRLTLTTWAKAAGVHPSVTKNAIIKDVWSTLMLDRALPKLGIILPTPEAVAGEGFPPVKKWNYAERADAGESPLEPPPSDVAGAVALLRRAPLERREEALNAVFRCISPVRPAALAVISQFVIPSPMNDAPIPGRQDALFAAHDSGMVVAFLTPDEARQKEMKERAGIHECPPPKKFEEAFEAYRAAYVRHRVGAGDDEGQAMGRADKLMLHVPYDEFAPSSWKYIVSLLCESDAHGEPGLYVIERGPASNNKPAALPPSHSHETGIAKYLKYAATRKKLEDHPVAVAFRNRLGGHA